MRFSHVLLTRPRNESVELAALMAPLGLRVIVQPAFDFCSLDAAVLQADEWRALEAAHASPLLVFTSTRAVSYGLDQLPAAWLSKCTVAAIGPSTFQALVAAGVQVNIHPATGFTSEALLHELQEKSTSLDAAGKSAFILAAPGGRQKMEEGLGELGWDTKVLMVYQRENAAIDQQKIQELNEAESILSVWTSANSMASLAQRLPPATWFRLSQGEWVVISQRLQRFARAYSPAKVHLSAGPTNTHLLSAIRAVV